MRRRSTSSPLTASVSLRRCRRPSPSSTMRPSGACAQPVVARAPAGSAPRADRRACRARRSPSPWRQSLRRRARRTHAAKSSARAGSARQARSSTSAAKRKKRADHRAILLSPPERGYQQSRDSSRPRHPRLASEMTMQPERRVTPASPRPPSRRKRREGGVRRHANLSPCISARCSCRRPRDRSSRRSCPCLRRDRGSTHRP